MIISSLRSKFDYFGARYYDSDLSVWLSVDPMADKYPSMSPFMYCAGNPVMLVDPDGDSLNVSNLTKSYQDLLISDLNSQTGLSLFVNSSGNLDYKKEGNQAVTTEDGSEKARNMLISAMDKETTVTVHSTSEVSSNSSTLNIIKINFIQTQDLVDNTVGVDKETMGFGMTFMHELSHNKFVGNGLSDNFSDINPRGDNVDFMNSIRSDLNLKGKNYGQRMSYNPFHFINEAGEIEIRMPFGNDGSAIDKYVKINK